MEDSRNIIKAIDALTQKAGGGVVDSKNIIEAIDRLRAVYDESAIGIDKTLTQEGVAADAKAVGDIINSLGLISVGDTNQQAVDIPNDAPTLCSVMNLAKGAWIIIGCIDWDINANGCRQISFTNALNPNRNLAVTAMAVDANGKFMYQQLVRFFNTNGGTVNLYCWQNSGAELTAYPYLYAMKIR